MSNCKYETPGCTCCHTVDHGACPTFEEGANGMCVYCDHSKECHERLDVPKVFGGNHNRPV